MGSQLGLIIEAPECPKERPSAEDWRAFETRFSAVPADFKAFIDQFGTGNIGGFIWVFNPASSNENLNLCIQVEKQLTALKGSRIPGLNLFPEKGGILPFGITDNGDLIAWKVEGRPDTWGVVVVHSRAPEYQEFSTPFREFLAGVLKKEIVCGIFPDDFPGSCPTFKSI
jgi:hypothetical protein